MANNEVYENVSSKLAKLYTVLEQEINLEIVKENTKYNHHKEETNYLKDKLEVLISLDRIYDLCNQRPEEIESIKKTLFNDLCEKQLAFRFLKEKELFLRDYIKICRLQNHFTTEFNREYIIRIKQVEVDLISRFLLEEDGFANYKEAIASQNELLEQAMEGQDSTLLSHCTNNYQNIFNKILRDPAIDLLLISKLKHFWSQVKKAMLLITPIRQEQLSTREGLAICFEETLNQSQSLEREIEKQMYRFALIGEGKKRVVSELKSIRNQTECTVFKEFHVKDKINQLVQCKQALRYQKECYFKNFFIDNYDQAYKELEIIENRFKKIMAKGIFDRPSFVERLFTVSKSNEERMVIKQEKNHYTQILKQVLNNDNIGIKQKETLVRLARNMSVVNTHSGRFFFHRTGKTSTRCVLDILDEKFQQKAPHWYH